MDQKAIKTIWGMAVIWLILAMVVMLSGCEDSQKQLLAEHRARIITDEVDRKLYLSLYQREVLNGILRQRLEDVYVNDCDLR